MDRGGDPLPGDLRISRIARREAVRSLLRDRSGRPAVICDHGISCTLDIPFVARQGDSRAHRYLHHSVEMRSIYATSSLGGIRKHT
jgi:hypothetical protein